MLNSRCPMPGFEMPTNRLLEERLVSCPCNYSGSPPPHGGSRREALIPLTSEPPHGGGGGVLKSPFRSHRRLVQFKFLQPVNLLVERLLAGFFHQAVAQ